MLCYSILIPSRQLTFTLLHRDFALTVALPPDRLCPPVPNRFNYILWIQDLLDTTAPSYRNDAYDPGRKVLGCDVGTGASAIYPLLACRQRENWRMLATEVDAESLEWARRNVEANGLGDRIRVVEVEKDGELVPSGVLKKVAWINFVMVNPPFYASEAEMAESARLKQRPPNSACTGAAVEMICEGGEVGFVKRLLEKSKGEEVQGKVQWWTSMLGKFSSVGVVVEAVKEAGCGNWAVTEFVQGQKTRRWAVGWSWMDLRPSVGVARGIPGLEKRLLPFPSEFAFDVKDVGSIGDLGDRLDREIRGLGVRWRWRPSTRQGLAMAGRDVWSRKARRRKTKDAMEEDEDEDQGPALVLKVALAPVEGRNAVTTNVRWLQGNDSVLFESFCGWLKRKIRNE